MKKKEILIIALLSFVTTIASGFVKWRSITCVIVNCVGVNVSCRGLPLTFAIDYYPSPHYSLDEIGSCADLPGQVNWVLFAFLFDTFFWFLALMVGLWTVKLLKQKMHRKAG